MTPLKSSLLAVALAFATGFPLSAQEPAEEAPASPNLELTDPVATVDGDPISKAELEDAFGAAVASAGVSPDQIPPAQRLAGYRQILNDMIMEKLVEGKSSDVSVPEDEVSEEMNKIKSQFPSEDAFKQQLERIGESPEELQDSIRAMLRQRKWIEGQIAGRDAVSEEDAKKYFEENKDQFKMPEQVTARHILFLVPEGAPEEVVKEKEAAAQKAIERANAGEDFGKLAEELSEDEGTRSRGGELPPFPRGDMVPEFEKAAFSQEVGKIGEPVRTQYGIHVIKVEDKEGPKDLSFDEVKSQLTAFLQSQKRQQAVFELVQGLRDKADVKINLPDGGDGQ